MRHRSSANLAYRQGAYRIVWRPERSAFQIIGNVDNRRYRFHAGATLREAKVKLRDFITEVESGWRPGEQRGDSWQAIAARVRNRHRDSANTREIPFDLSCAYIFALMKEADFRCTVSGIALSKKEKGARFVDPWATSIDRIDNRIGYVVDNVRIVCVAANLAMNQWGYDVLLRLAKAVVANARAPLPEQHRTPIVHLALV